MLGLVDQALAQPIVCVRPGVSPMKNGLSSSFQRASQAGAFGRGSQALSGKSTEMRLPPTCCLSFSQLAALGHAVSPGRTREPIADLGSAKKRYGSSADRSGSEATCLRRVRRSMEKYLQDDRADSNESNNCPILFRQSR